MIDAYEKAEAYVRSAFSYSNASQDVIEAARSAYVAGFEEHMSVVLQEKEMAGAVPLPVPAPGSGPDSSGLND